MTARLPEWAVRWQPRSLRTRFSLLAVVVAGVVVALLGTATVAALDSRLDSAAHDLLRTRVQAAAALVNTDPRNGTLQVDPDDGVLDEGTWVFRGRTALARSSAPPEVQAAVSGLIGSTGFHDVPGGDGGMLLYALRLPEQGGRSARWSASCRSRARPTRSTPSSCSSSGSGCCSWSAPTPRRASWSAGPSSRSWS